MMRSFTIGIAALAAASLAVSGAMAQSKPMPAEQKTQPPAEQKAMPGAEQPKADKQMGQKLEGTIKSVDAKGVVTLADGTKLMIPKTVSVPKAKLKPGAQITAEYEEKGGQKVATAVQIKG